MNEKSIDIVPLVDAHCHVGTTPHEIQQPVHELSNDKISRALMSNNPYDWARLQLIQFKKGNNSSPQYKGFGIHPWYSHLFTFKNEKTLTKEQHYRQILNYKESDSIILTKLIQDVLPDPVYIEEYISNIDFSNVNLIGEIGLDKSFYIPSNGFYQGHSNDAEVIITKTKIKVSMDHQVKVFKRMLQLACDKSLNVSLHDVNCHMKLFDICQQYLLNVIPIKICLHSYTGSIEFLLSQWIKKFTEQRIFISVSQYISFKKDEGNLDYSQVPHKCILTETDYIVDNGVTEISLQDSLEDTLEKLAKVLPLGSSHETRRLVFDNFCRFMHNDL
ncbi:similar to Saccharomyces cerevisiae YMR262W Protein of unknown function [Maudiozyma saulgeensis]|uniref:Uncharacterized protein n=1 Tax=Maudiozyma saulgeensis TaxID=1789683 RepID=A0A1X7R8Q4_9SACH|nr:similar to Saccharomyces cerevisiae YMR262W Protein of unknown function [Kazachstania saulgeensis]